MSLQVFDERQPLVRQYEATFTDGASPFELNRLLPIWSRFDYIWVTCTDTIDQFVQVALNTPTGEIPLGQVNVPAGSGYAGVPSVDLLFGLFGVSGQGIVIPSDTDLRFRIVAGLGAAAIMDLNALGGYF
jgi:hypothetical protein